TRASDAHADSAPVRRAERPLRQSVIEMLTKPLDGIPDHGQIKGFLGGKVVKHRRLAHAGPSRDGSNRSGGITSLREDGRGRLQQALQPARRSLVYRGFHVHAAITDQLTRPTGRLVSF